MNILVGVFNWFVEQTHYPGRIIVSGMKKYVLEWLKSKFEVVFLDIHINNIFAVLATGNGYWYKTAHASIRAYLCKSGRHNDGLIGLHRQFPCLCIGKVFLFLTSRFWKNVTLKYSCHIRGMGSNWRKTLVDVLYLFVEHALNSGQHDGGLVLMVWNNCAQFICSIDWVNTLEILTNRFWAIRFKNVLVVVGTGDKS